MNTLATPNPNSTLQQPQEPVKTGFVLWLLTLWFVLVGVLFAWLFSYARVSLGTPIQAVILGKWFSMLLPCVLGVWCVFRGKGLVARSVLVCCLWQCAVIMLLTMGSTHYRTDMGDFFDYRIRIEPRFASAEFVAQLARGIMLTISLVFMLYIIFSKRVGTIYNRRGQKL